MTAPLRLVSDKPRKKRFPEKVPPLKRKPVAEPEPISEELKHALMLLNIKEQ